MSIIINCYDHAIGLSRTDCTCYETDKPVDFNTSLSGLYLDELEPLNKLSGLDNCENGSIWDAMTKARENAVMRFIADTNSRLVKDYELKRAVYKGGIGRAKHTANKSVNQIYAGVRVYCADIISGTIKLKQIGTIFNATGTITLTIYNNLGEIVAGTLTLNTVANTHTLNNIEDIELPLHSDYIENLEYYFIYTYSDTNIPRNNDLDCNCGNFKPIFNLGNPYFNKRQSQRYGWANYFMMGGIEKNDLDFSDVCISSTGYLYGLTFDMEIYCKIGDVLCKDGIDLDYTSDPISASIAHAILYKSGEIALRMMIGNPDLSRLAMIEKETMEKFMFDYKGKYNKMLDYIIPSIDLKKTDCLMCRDKIKMINAGVLA